MAEVRSSSSRPDWATRALEAEFEPLPRIGLLQSARRYWYLVLAPVVVFAAIAVIAAEKRTPHYTAQARLMVGRLNISTPGAVAGFAQAAQDLASAYPLVIDATGVIDPLAKEFHTTPASIRSQLSSTQVPTSPIVEVLATGSSGRYAVRLANAASTQLVTYLTNFNRDNPDADRLLKANTSAQLNFQRDLAALQAVSKHNSPLSPPNQKIAAKVAVDKVQTSGLGSDYQLTLQTQAITSLLQPLQFADTASNDKQSKLQIALFAAVIAGLIVGLGLAVLRANMVARRALTTPSWAPPPPSNGAKGEGSDNSEPPDDTGADTEESGAGLPGP